MTVTLVKRLPRNDSYSGTNRYRALVRCDCGNEYESGYYSYKKSKSCKGCMYKGRVVNSNDVSRTIFGRLVKSARVRGIECTIDLPYLAGVYESQKFDGEDFARCTYSGYPLINDGSTSTTMSVDRIDSSGPYRRGNVQFVDKQVNISKHTLDEQRFLFLVHQATVPILYPAVDVGFPERVKQFRGSGAFSGERVGAIRNNAKRRGIYFDLTAEQLHQQFVRQRGICAFSGLGLFPETVSVDRIDNHAGYTKDNIHLVLKEMNFMRGKLTIDEFRVMLDDIFEWRFIKNLKKRNDV